MPATMTIADVFLGEFEQELETTRRFLERIPADKLTWKPHEKSHTAGQLGLHIAISPGLVAGMAQTDTCEMPDFDDPFPHPASVGEILEALDEDAAKVRQIVAGFSDDDMARTWSVTKDGNVVMEMPRVGFLRSIMLNHTYHHRGQLGVYLRLMGCDVPWAYGPSGDEAPPGMEM